MFEALPLSSVVLFAAIALPLAAGVALRVARSVVRHSHYDIGPPMTLPYEPVDSVRWNVRGAAGRAMDPSPREDHSGTWSAISTSISVSGLWPIAE